MLRIKENTGALWRSKDLDSVQLSCNVVRCLKLMPLLGWHAVDQRFEIFAIESPVSVEYLWGPKLADVLKCAQAHANLLKGTTNSLGLMPRPNSIFVICKTGLEILQ